MERKLFYYIMTPAMILSWLFGIFLIFYVLSGYSFVVLCLVIYALPEVNRGSANAVLKNGANTSQEQSLTKQPVKELTFVERYILLPRNLRLYLCTVKLYLL